MATLKKGRTGYKARLIKFKNVAKTDGRGRDAALATSHATTPYHCWERAWSPN